MKRQFTAEGPGQVSCGDVTMIRTGRGPLYLATVIDLFSGRCLGYAISDHHDQQLTIASLRMAAATGGGTVAGCVWRTDRGGEYTGDDILTESFNCTLKTEFIHRRFFATRAPKPANRSEHGSKPSTTPAAAIPGAEGAAPSPSRGTPSKINSGPPHDGPVYTLTGD